MPTANGPKVKTYKNPERNKQPEHVPYIPQYQVLGVEPNEYKSAAVSGNVKIARNQPLLPTDNPRVRRPMIHQSYGEVATSPVGRGKGPIPNVGNNVDQVWSGLDGGVIDDLEGNLDPNHPMIDNNDFVGEIFLDEGQTLPAKLLTQTATNDHSQSFSDELSTIVCDLEEGAYLLIVSGVAICSGPMEEIQEQANLLIFGEHEVCDGNPIPDKDLIILKRVPVKIGLFLE